MSWDIAYRPVVQDPVIPPDPGSAPQWFLNLNYRQWTPIANGVGQTLAEQTPVPAPLQNQLGGAVTDLVCDWTGCAYDQALRRIYLPANGGHSSWCGNEGYWLDFMAASPRWRRLWDTTPNLNGSGAPYYPQFSDPLLNNASHWPTSPVGLYLDGRVTAGHNQGIVFAKNKVWFPFHNSWSNGAGDGSNLQFSVNLGHAGIVSAMASGVPMPWNLNNIAPWEIWGETPGVASGQVLFGSGDYDPITQKLWYFGGKGEVTVYGVCMDLSNPNAPVITPYVNQPPFNTGEFNTWHFICPELRIMVCGDSYDIPEQGRNHIAIFNLDTQVWTKAASMTGTPYWGDFQGNLAVGAGAGYCPVNHSAAIGHPRSIGPGFRRLVVPTKVVGGNTVYDSAGSWVWTSPSFTIASGTGPAEGSGTQQFGNTYTHFGTIQDMGNGETMVVSSSAVDKVWVYRCPPGGL